MAQITFNNGTQLLVAETKNEIYNFMFQDGFLKTGYMNLLIVNNNSDPLYVILVNFSLVTDIVDTEHSVDLPF